MFATFSTHYILSRSSLMSYVEKGRLRPLMSNVGEHTVSRFKLSYSALREWEGGR